MSRRGGRGYALFGKDRAGSSIYSLHDTSDFWAFPNGVHRSLLPDCFCSVWHSRAASPGIHDVWGLFKRAMFLHPVSLSLAVFVKDLTQLPVLMGVCGESQTLPVSRPPVWGLSFTLSVGRRPPPTLVPMCLIKIRSWFLAALSELKFAASLYWCR